MAARFRWSLAVYRLLLLAYPASFRGRFGDDLAADVADLFLTSGRLGAWRRILPDLARSVPAARRAARAARLAEEANRFKGDDPMSALLFDLRHAIRMLGKAPVFTVVTIVTLAVGIGANSATFSLVNAALLAPLGYRDADRLLLVYEGIPQASLPKMAGSPPDILDLRRETRTLDPVEVFRCETRELSGAGEPQRIDVTRTTAGVFPMLGVAPAFGRSFRRAEDATEGHNVVILSHAFWQRVYGDRKDVIGRTIRLDRAPYEIVGVMPAGFEFPKRGPVFNGRPAEAWVPLAFTDEERASRAGMFNNGVLARPKPGVSLAEVQKELEWLAPRVRENYPAEMRSSPYQLTMSAAWLRDEISGQIRTPLLVLFAAVALVLLVACANVANLILSRAAGRQREIGVRVALGAPRWRLVQLLLCEAALLSLAGGALGLALGRAVLGLVPATLSVSLPGLQAVSFDGRVVLFTVGLSVATAVVFALVPVLGADHDVAGRLRESGGRTVGGRRTARVQRALVTATVTLAVVLLVSAGLLVRSFAALTATDPGFEPERVMTMMVALPNEAYRNDAEIAAFIRTAHERVRALPGVTAAAISTDLPLESEERRAMSAEGAVATGVPPAVSLTWTYGAYFRTLGVPLKRGRLFTTDEDQRSRPAVIVSESLATHFWPGRDPIGKRIKWGLPSSTSPWLEIVGVVGNVNDGPLGAEPMLHVYVPLLAAEPDHLGFMGRSLRFALVAQADPAALMSGGRRAIASLDPSLPVTRVATMQQRVDESVGPQRFSTVVLGGFAVAALLLAAIGLYGVLAFLVAERTTEIGVRMALGASEASVLGLVMREGMQLVGIGLVLGLAGAAAVTRVMASLLYRTEPWDPWAFAMTPVVLAIVALAACYLPARRAASVEPVTALRAE